MIRSSGTARPAIDSNVVNQSVTCMISLLSRPAAMCPGQRAMHGVRSDASMPVKYEPSQVTTRPAVEQGFLVAVVAGENDDGVLGDAGGRQCVQKFAEISVEL